VDTIAVGLTPEVGMEEEEVEEVEAGMVGEGGTGVEAEVEAGETVTAEEEGRTVGCDEGTHSPVSRTRSIRLEGTVEEEGGMAGAVEDAEEAEGVEEGISSPCDVRRLYSNQSIC
jgi:hypothetical protein